MRSINKSAILGISLALATGFLFTTAMQAKITKGKSRPMTTKQLMNGVVKAHCGALKKGLEAGPSDDKAWDAIAMHAAILNESSFTLMDDGRCPDGVWAGATTKNLRVGSADVLKAVEARDLDAAKAAFKNVTKSCSACHKAHKPKKKK